MTKKALKKKEVARMRKGLRDPLAVARHLAQLLDPSPKYRPK